MFIMKKIIYALILVFVLTCGSMITNASVSQKPTAISEIIGRPLLDYSEYQKLNTDEIDSLKIIRFTEGGVSEREIKDKTEIYKFQGYLKDIKLLKETGMSCTDNTTIYSFKMKDGSKVSIEFECDWIVIKGKNYLFETPYLKKNIKKQR